MKKQIFSLTLKDEEMLGLIEKTSQKILALWAIDCAERVIPNFEEKYPLLTHKEKPLTSASRKGHNFYLQW